MPFAPHIAAAIKQAAHEAGFDLCGIAPVARAPELDYFPGWVEAGHGGEMRYLGSRNEQGHLKRSGVEHIAPWARSVVVCALNYNTAAPQSGERGRGSMTRAGGSETRRHENQSRGWISRYAWGGKESPADYHDVVLSRLRAVETLLATTLSEPLQTRCYVDTGPVLERAYAKYAGVGWIGKNTCIIDQKLGSWLFLGVILTSLELEPDLPAPDRCGSCTRCLDACPTDAFLGPHELDATRCISYLTIEKRGDIPEELRAGMGRHVFGCDICQEVCPWNRRAPVTALPEFQPHTELVNPALDGLARMTDEEFRQRFRGSPIQRTRRAGLRRNAIVAMGNSGDAGFLPLLRELAADADQNLSSHAEWALRRLQETLHCPVVQRSDPRQDHGTGPRDGHHDRKKPRPD